MGQFETDKTVRKADERWDRLKREMSNKQWPPERKRAQRENEMMNEHECDGG